MKFDLIKDFLEPINVAKITDDEGFNKSQLGAHFLINRDGNFDSLDFDIAIIGSNEYRGLGIGKCVEHAANNIRKELYKLYLWKGIYNVADLGNVKVGNTLNESYAALSAVIKFLLENKKKVLIIGGSQDITIPQYQSYKGFKRLVDCINIDPAIDFDVEGNLPAYNYLENLFTSLPNHLRHFNLIGFQNYFSNIEVLETMDNLSFDSMRIGEMRRDMLECEPVFRNSHFVSLDVNVIQYSHAPSNINSINGLDGVEICQLAMFAGMSNLCTSFGIYNFVADNDVKNLTAKQLAQMIWNYLIGHALSLGERPLKDKKFFLVYHIEIPQIHEKFVFLKSTVTNRWWMMLKDNKFIACSQSDFFNLKNNQEIPDRWLREMERQ
ncbi:MAG: arginase family protein [Sediminibacterium sp.]|nr:arginase family protein [Sediminibacterium sp.]